MRISEESFRKVLGLFPTGVTVVTSHLKKGEDVGLTISSFTSVSLDPQQILFCLSKRSKTMPVFKDASYFAVNILSSDQSFLADGFAKHTPPQWGDIKTERHPDSHCLLLSGALGHVICEKKALYDGGDHAIILGKVIDLRSSLETAPLVRQRGQYLTTHTLNVETSCNPIHRKPRIL